jgi:AcrR family transcriptional regulator
MCAQSKGAAAGEAGAGGTEGGGTATDRTAAPADEEEAHPARQRLLDDVVAHFTAEGLADQSLRRIAEAVGTSHRMLLYHFGSKDGLLLAVVREVEARTQAHLADLGQDAPGDAEALLRRMWSYVADPALGDLERLFFALYGRALQGEESIRPLLENDIGHWLDLNVALTAPQGVPADVARTHGRLALAVTRGLLLDLLATGDRAGAQAALDVFAGFYEGRWWVRQEETGNSDRAS